tara:strand:- start:35 stop:184 length:150 start_codon:yes stop_codon:yes gene_type:complete
VNLIAIGILLETQYMPALTSDFKARPQLLLSASADDLKDLAESLDTQRG